MENDMELRLVNSLTKKSIYEKCSPLIDDGIFADDLEDIIQGIKELQEKYNTDLDMEIVEHHITNKKVYSTAKKKLLKDILCRVSTKEIVCVEMAKDFIYKLFKKKQGLSAMNELAQCMENSSDYDSVVSILSDLSIGEKNEDELVPASLEGLSKFYNDSRNIPLNIGSLQREIRGLARGNLAIVFGRPEIGKSSFVAHQVATFIKSGLHVEYYANEEPGLKIILNIRRAVTGETDEKIMEAINAKEDHPKWIKAQEFLKVREIGVIDIDTIIARTKRDKPDIVVLDQVDKISINRKKFNATHEKLKELYVRTRELAKTGDCLVINVSQASVDADGVDKLHYSMLDGSKTGKAGEADIIIGIGKADFMKETGIDIRKQIRYINISKNKITGWHGDSPVIFNARTNQWKDEVDTGVR